MRIDTSRSIFHEDPHATREFTRAEIRRCRYILRRLRFLEEKVRENGGVDNTSGGAAHSEWEIEALEWLLTEIGFLSEDKTEREPAHNR